MKVVTFIRATHCHTDFFAGKTALKELGISKVFDLRSDTEIRKYNTPLPQIDGVEILHTPVFQTEDYSPEMMAKYVRVVHLNQDSLFRHLQVIVFYT